MLWLLMTGKIPTEAETRQLSCDLADRGELPEFVEKLVDSYVVVIWLCLSKALTIVTPVVYRLPYIP